MEYENGDRPQAVLEKGNPKAGKLFSFSVARDFQTKITSLKSRAIYDNIMDTFDFESLAFLRESCLPIMVSQKLYNATCT